MKDKKEQKAVVKSCKRYIETHLYEDITTQSLADLNGYTYRTLWRYFKDVGRYTVPEYVRIRRVHLAARFLRHGSSIDAAFEGSFFRSKSSFVRAFTDYYGISPWEFEKTRGMVLMREPKIMKRPSFHIVGYMFAGAEPYNWEESGAYYIIQDFPEVSAREWARIGGGFDMVGTWMEKEGEFFYIFGPGIQEVRYVPKGLGTLYVPGGEFAVFPVEKTKDPEDTTVLGENVRVTWYYALSQWLPDSDYELDETRIPYEYYLDGNNRICVPIVPKIKPPKRKRTKTSKTTEN